MVPDYWRCFHGNCLRSQRFQYRHTICYLALDRAKWTTKYVHRLWIYQSSNLKPRNSYGILG